MMSRGRPVPSIHSKYEPANAAPEPTIAAGPRKQENPTATGPVFVNAAQKQSALRKTTTQSDLRTASNTSIPQEVRDQASEFVRTNGIRGESHSSASGPASGTTRRKDAASGDKPGFFKRVFGGSSTRSSAAESPHGYDVAGPSRKHSFPKKDDSQHPSDSSVNVSHPPVSLNKKPSSFFRRRKRSISENAPPPALPSNIAIGGRIAQPSPSISSLREVMDSYLSKTETPSKLRLQDEQPQRSKSRDSRNDSRTED